MQLTDAEILEKFVDPESRSYAFNLLVRQYQQKIYWAVRRLIIDHDDANDVVQNVWIKVWQNLAQFKGESQLYTWIYRIAANEALGFLKKKKTKFFLPIHNVEAELINKIDQNVGFDGDALEKKLQKAILSLPEKQRLVFQMRYYDEMPYEEMSKVVNTSVGALKASYHIAAKKIADYIKTED